MLYNNIICLLMGEFSPFIFIVISDKVGVRDTWVYMDRLIADGHDGR